MKIGIIRLLPGLVYLSAVAATIRYAYFLLGESSPSVWRQESLPWEIAFPIDMLLIGMFFVLNTIAMGPAFKKIINHRFSLLFQNTFKLCGTSIPLGVLCCFWEPIPYPLLGVESELVCTLLWFIYFSGWVIVVAGTLLVNHVEMSGLGQAWNYGRDEEIESPPARTPWFFQILRRPDYFGWLLVHWIHPNLTVGQLLLASMATVYIVLALSLERREEEESPDPIPHDDVKVIPFQPNVLWGKKDSILKH
jgi:methanethiol S-methyltransferase